MGKCAVLYSRIETLRGKKGIYIGMIYVAMMNEAQIRPLGFQSSELSIRFLMNNLAWRCCAFLQCIGGLIVLTDLIMWDTHCNDINLNLILLS